MKNNVIIGFLIIFLLIISKDSFATVSGECGDCHGLFPGLLDERLIRQYDSSNVLCVTCHSSDSKEPIKILGRSRVPVVFNTIEPEGYLSGGNFFYVAQYGGDRKGHNVDGIAKIDAKFIGEPPGYDRELDPSVKGYIQKDTLKCAGSNGCHGNRNIEDPFKSIMGSHHAIDKPIDGSTTPRSYRFLKNTDKIKGITGLEDADWGFKKTAEKHNEYTVEMDMFCASCHGAFHKKDMTGKLSPWFRHPTGIVLPKTGEYSKYNPHISPPDGKTGIRIYNPDAPVGRQNMPLEPSNEVKLGEDMVICLSCHVAHGSAYDSILRWDYDNIFAHEGGKTGCLICHTGKAE